MSGESLEFGVILTADNKAYVPEIRNAKNETAALKKVASDTAVELDKLGTAGSGAGRGASEMAAGAQKQAQAASGASGAVKSLGAASERTKASTENLTRAGKSSETQMGRGRGAVGGLAQSLLGLVSSNARAGSALQQTASAAADLAGGLAANAGKGRILSSVMTALGGVFGNALGAGIGYVVGELASSAFGLNENDDAARDLIKTTDTLADAQSILGDMFDLATGKIKDNTELTKLNTLAKIDNQRATAEADRRDAIGVFNDASVKTTFERALQFDLGGLFAGRSPGAGNQVTPVASIFDAFQKSGFSAQGAFAARKSVNNLSEESLRSSGTDRLALFGAITKLANSVDVLTVKTARETRSVETGRLDRRFLKPERERSNRAVRDVTAPGAVTANEVGRLLVKEFGGRVTSTTNHSKFTANGSISDHFRGAAVDFVPAGGVTAISKDDIESFLLSKGIKIRNSPKFGKQLLGPGDKGHSDHFHAAFERDRLPDSETSSGLSRAAALRDRKKREADALNDFGAQSAEKIQRLNEQFDRTPRAVDQANASIRETNFLMKQLKDHRPPGFERMIADAEKLAPLIRESLKRPVLDLIDAGERDLELGRARLSNDQGRVDALQLTTQLMDRLGVENESQLATELARRGISGEQVRDLYAQLDATRQQTRELELQGERQANNLGVLRDANAAARDGIRGLLSGEGLNSVGSTFKRIASSYKDALATELNDKLFGDFFRAQEDKVTGRDKVTEAGERIATKVEAAATTIAKSSNATANAFDKITVAGLKAAAALDPTSKTPATDLVKGALGANQFAAAASAASFVADSLFGTAEKINKGGDEIVVQARQSVNKVLQDALSGALVGVFGAKTAGRISRTAVGLARGATVGTVVSGTLNSIGIGQSGTGASVGGAIGAQVFKALAPKLFASLGALGGPIGQVAGALLGGTLGKLLSKPKTGSASISFDGTGYSAGSVGGNSAALQDRSRGVAGSVGGQISQLAQQLGGVLTSAGRVSIGYDKKGRVVVDTTGQNRTKGAGVRNFGKDGEAAATAFAVADALADGAIAGISAKVRAALTSSSDLEKSVREALKVDEIETLLSGFGGASRKVFVDFERQAGERLRIASKYGFDLVKLEEVTGRDRVKLFESSVEQAVGGLKTLLEDLTTGERAPGTILDRRAALLARKDELTRLAPTDADAAAKLAQVLDQLDRINLEAFGTAGAQFAGDRANIRSTAEAIIAQATAELRTAQNDARTAAGTGAAATEQLIGQSNTLLDQIRLGISQGNDISAELLRQMSKTPAVAGGSGVDAAFALGRSVF
jgi:hypothetical protein